MKNEELLRNITEMAKLTKEGKLNWKIVGQTTEYNQESEKPKVNEEGMDWIVDECYISYECEYKGKDFLMITYEMIHTSQDKKKSINLVFLPPMGIRYFDLHTLLPYSIEASKILIYEIHQLWLLILEMNKAGAHNISLDMSPRTLTIEDDNIKSLLS